MRKFVAILLAIFLVFPLLLSAQAAVSVTSWVLDRQFYIDALDQPQVYTTFTSGPMIDKLLHDQIGLPPEADTVDTSSLRVGLSGAAPIPPSQLAECESRFHVSILEAYGSTENSGGISAYH